MLKTALGLYDRGFAVHWLRSFSKAPIDIKWTGEYKKSLADISEQYRKGMNLGVRLGKSSKLDKGFLAVVDCDVKSEDKRHEWEMLKRFDELFGKELRAVAPIVLSGRGNGSAHFYIQTGGPIKPKRLAQSKDTVKVKMPSVKPSPRDKASLSEEELASGLRLRAAWEISLMGDGQQVVLPPSIHPDSRKPYKWGRQGDIPLVDVTGLLGDKVSSTGQSESLQAIEDFEPVAVELFETSLSDRIVNMIETGEDVEDRSAALFGVSLAMVRAGLSDTEILSVLTDPNTFLGQAAYEHAKTNSRKRAALWIEKYTLRKARNEADAAKQFEAEVAVSTLTEEESLAHHRELIAEGDWRYSLERSGKDGSGPPRSTLQNVVLVLTNAVREDIFRRNEFSGRDYYAVNTPWGGRSGQELTDDDAVRIKFWLGYNYRFEPNVNLVFEAMREISLRNKFHPVRSYVEHLKWDGVERIDTWLKKYLGAEGPEEYLRAVSRKVLCAMVARVFKPGTKFDHVLILEGKQGIGKSSAGRYLASEHWFCDTLPDVRDKDAMLNLQGAWIVEISELATLKRADSETYKAFFTRQTDRVRAPYGRAWQEYPRQCIFIGTTNSESYLKDKSGNRRFWPVKVTGCDFAALMKDRDQLLAEARIAWEEFDELLYLEGKAKEEAEELQEMRVGEDEESLMQDKLADFFEAEGKKPEDEQFDLLKFSISQLFEGPEAPLGEWKKTTYNLHLVGNALRALGYESYKTMGRKAWRPKSRDPRDLAGT